MANSQPIFTKIGDIQWANDITVGNTNENIVAGTSYHVFTADSTSGGYVQRIRFRPLGSNIATVARVWINNGNSPTGATANNVLWDEVSLAASTQSNTSALANTELPLNFALPPAYKLYVTLGTGVTAGYDVSVIGGKY
jgi:hypothetical protein